MTIIIDTQSSGISGNMIIGALADLGCSTKELKEVMELSGQYFGGVEVSFKKVNKCGITSTYCNVNMLNKEEHVSYSDLISKIEDIPIDKKIIDKSKKVFKRIAEAESKVHGETLDKIHFHEVGASDAVADVIGSIYAYYSLGLDKDKIIGLPISVGGGVVKSEHGIIPIPAPATVEILKGAKIIGGPVLSELATPTGSAIYMEICDEIEEFIPIISPEKVGFGAGSKDLDYPNVLRIIKSENLVEKDTVDVLETNIDHLTGEEVGYLFDKLLSSGARDVSVIPILMKKNRQGSLLKVISKKEDSEKLLNIIFEEVGTLGIRIQSNIHRGISGRKFLKEKIEVNGKNYEVTFKKGIVANKTISIRPEYEDIKKIAEENNIPFRDVLKIANLKINKEKK